MSDKVALALKVTWVGAWVNLFLSVIKIVFGWLGQSQALIADGIHSLSDLVTDIIVAWGSKVGNKSADLEHPYGHARIETLATVIMGVVLFLVSIGIFIDALLRLIEPEKLSQPTALALVIAIVSIFVKEILFRYTLKASQEIDSQLLRANAWHHRTDAISSVVVVVGVCGSFIGMPWWDAVAAIGVALMLGHLSHELAWTGLKELIDTGASAEELVKINQCLNNITAVKAVHQLRTRKMGNQILVDVHILVDEDISVSEGHQISEVVRFSLMAVIDNIAEVMVHIDPENDELKEITHLNKKLPLRQILMQQLQQYWQMTTWREQPVFAQIQSVKLHYLEGQLRVDVYFPLNILIHPHEDLQTQAQRLHNKLIQNLPETIQHSEGNYTLQLSVFFS